MDLDGTSLSDVTTGLLHLSNRITSSLRLILLAMSADVVSDREHPLVTLGRDRMLRQLESRIAWPGKADSGSAMSCSARSKRVFTFCLTLSLNTRFAVAALWYLGIGLLYNSVDHSRSSLIIIESGARE
jgi:hypothetical protein